MQIIVFENVLKRAEDGKSDTQLYLCYMYARGEVVEQDYEKAFEWCVKAVEQCDSDAQFNLDNMYRTGHGIKQICTKAIDWYEKVVEHGCDDAFFFHLVVFIIMVAIVSQKQCIKKL